MKKIKIADVSDAIDQFTNGELKLYTPKNHKEFIRIISIDDAIRYMYRLYKKDIS